MDDDLFDAFDEVQPTSGHGDVSTNGNDKMAGLELQKRNEAREFSENLLGRLSSGAGRKRTNEDDDVEEPPVKIPAADEFDDNEDVNLDIADSPSIAIHSVFASDNCTHEVTIPQNQTYTPLQPRNDQIPAKTYEFKLDPFQRQAVLCIENNQSVLVSAHTSAGKTAVAQYAIAKALKDKQRVIYTSPIKALSNQKFRELNEEFTDVGLVTGDVTLNPNASCVVMTTEILRSMLYRGAEIMREVGWVIFDEIHYMRDKERGVVWEEAIILLPDNVHYVFLSATIPNARQFAEWICYLHHQPCHVVYTDYRPTPLQHFIYSNGSDGLYEVVDVKGNFREDQFAKAMSFLKSDENSVVGSGRGGPERRRTTAPNSDANVIKIIRTIRERDMLPCIIFSFSRKDCEAYASTLKGVDFNSDDEKKAVRIIYDNAISLLSDEDRKLPQISILLPFLLRGIGVHHSGLLPILKEVTEILFGEGFIKTLFATETFAMGLNMPAKTVLFTSARKFDGQQNRWMTSGEYIQMSGRAGRRGKDDRGLVIMMVDQQLSAEDAKRIIKGDSDPLNSQFRLTYNMVLNLLRVPDINPRYMLEKSFYQFQNFEKLPQLHKKMKDKQLELEGCHVDNEFEISGFCELEKRIRETQESIRQRVLKPVYIVPYFQPGRLLKIKSSTYDFDWAPLVSYSKKPDPLNPMSGQQVFIIEVAVVVSKDSSRYLSSNLSNLRPPANDEPGVVEVVPFTFECIRAISTIRLKLPENLKSAEARQSIAKTLAEAKKRMNSVVPEVDPIEHMHINDASIVSDVENLVKCQTRFKTHAITTRPDFEQIKKDYEHKLKLQEEFKQSRADFRKARSLLQEEDLACRKRVLRRLQYCGEDDIITLKGRVACELSSADELLLTEMIFTAAFNSLSPAHCAALLSCFVCEERSNSAGKIDEELSGYLRNLQSHARKIAKIATEAKVELDEEKYVDSFSSALMSVVYKWCAGATFREIVQSTDIFEGSIIRCMRRLELVLSEMENAARSHGDKELEAKFETAGKLLKRDIVFSASLYL